MHSTLDPVLHPSVSLRVVRGGLIRVENGDRVAYHAVVKRYKQEGPPLIFSAFVYGITPALRAVNTVGKPSFFMADSFSGE